MPRAPQSAHPAPIPSPSSVADARWSAAVTHLLFAVGLWFIATFAFLGDLGQWSDDYAYTFTHPATGGNALEIGHSLVPFFWRPLYYMTVPWLQSELGGHWVNHLLSAIVRGAVSLLLYVFLRRQGVWRSASCAAAIGLMAFPAAWEVSFWLSAMPTGVMGAMFLVLSLVCLRWFRAPTRVGWRTWTMPPVIFVLAFSVPCWNEQIGAAAPALLLLTLGERGADGRRPWRRGLVASIVACAAQALYLVLYWTTKPPGGRGGADSIVHPAELPERIALTLRGMQEVGLMRDFGLHAVQAGFRALADHPWAGVVGITAVVLAGGGWLTRVTRESPSDSALARTDRTVATIVFGLAVFALAWLPVVMVQGQSVESRLWFAPAIGLVIAIAGCLQWLAQTRAGPRPAARLALATVFLALLIPATVALVGIQSAMHARKQLDERQAAQITRLVPAPAPWTVFVPLEIMRPRGERWSRFVTMFYGPWEHVAAATPSLREAYGRNDVAMGWRRFSPRWSPVLGATAEGLVYDDRLVDDWMRLYHRVPKGTPPPTTLAWSRVIPFVIDPDGNIVLVEEVRVDDAGSDLVYPVTSVLGLIAERRLGPLRVARVRIRTDTRARGDDVTFRRIAN